MLKPSECFAGPISAATGMTLVLPTSEYKQRMLIVTSEGKQMAICLDDLQGFDKFVAFESSGNDHWKGLQIPSVCIELDETALWDLDRQDAPLGAMIRTGDKLAIKTLQLGDFGRDRIMLPFMEELPPCVERYSACFLKWQITLGEGDAKRVLHTVDLRTKPTGG